MGAARGVILPCALGGSAIAARLDGDAGIGRERQRRAGQPFAEVRSQQGESNLDHAPPPSQDLIRDHAPGLGSSPAVAAICAGAGGAGFAAGVGAGAGLAVSRAG